MQTLLEAIDLGISDIGAVEESQKVEDAQLWRVSFAGAQWRSRDKGRSWVRTGNCGVGEVSPESQKTGEIKLEIKHVPKGSGSDRASRGACGPATVMVSASADAVLEGAGVYQASAFLWGQVRVRIGANVGEGIGLNVLLLEALVAIVNGEIGRGHGCLGM
jgi:hypothetical protein